MDYKLYHGDCMDILPTMADGSVDAVVTDPPYGVNFSYSEYDDTAENWEQLMLSVMPHILRVSKFAVLPCGSRSRAQVYWN